MERTDDLVTSDGIIIRDSIDGVPYRELAAAIDGVAASLQFVLHGETCHLTMDGTPEMEIRSEDYRISIRLQSGSMYHRPRATVAAALAGRALDIARVRAARKHAGPIAQPWECKTTLETAKAILVSGGTFEEVLSSMATTLHGNSYERRGSWPTGADDTIFFGYTIPDLVRRRLRGFNGPDLIDHEIQIDGFRLARDAVMDGKRWNGNLTITKTLDDATMAAVGNGEGLHDLLRRPFLAVFPLALHKPVRSTRSTSYKVIASRHPRDVRMAPIPQSILDEGDRIMRAIAEAENLDPQAHPVKQPPALFEPDVAEILRSDESTQDAPAVPTLAERLRAAFENAAEGVEPWEAVAREALGTSAVSIPTPHRQWRRMFVEHLNLSKMPRSALLDQGIRTAGDVHDMTRHELSRIPNLGKKGLQEIDDAIADLLAA